MSDKTTKPPLLSVVRGDPTAEELAAVVAVLAARAVGGDGSPGPARRGARNDPGRLVRTTVSAHPGGWRASGLPR